MQIYRFLTSQKNISKAFFRNPHQYLIFGIVNLLSQMKSIYKHLPIVSSQFPIKIISWYNQNKRELPWRQTTDPYLIWISEIILQQTRVVQGYDYFVRFIQRFPDIESLAHAPEDEVMKYWQGLGYYSRARNLHAAAKSMNGIFPHTYEGVLALKGVGEYTAAAICSISYNLPYAVVDGNVYRVLSRYFGIESPIDSTSGKKEIKELAQVLIDINRPAQYNQAIMEFGALQCIPKSPDCTVCPLADSCVALGTGKIKQLPVKQHKTQMQDRYLNYLFVRAGEYTYIRKRTENDIWKSLYEFPLIETGEAVAEEQFYSLPAFKSLFAENEIPTVHMAQRDVKHVLSHRILHVNFYEIILSTDSHSFSGYEKIRISNINQYAIPRLIHAFLEKYL